MRTCAQITIRDETDISITPSEPAAPTQDELWLDTSVTPNTLKRWDGTAWVAVGPDIDLTEYYTKTQLDTKLTQTDAAIALKADKTVTDSLGNRLETAEATLTTQAGQISSVVTQSQTTTNTLNALTIGGRNYVLNSNATLELNHTGSTFTSVWLSPAPIMSDDFLTDCLGKNILISYYAMCENLVRADTGSWIGIQITFNTDTPNVFVYSIMTVTTTLDSGTKPWARYRLTTTIPSNAVSVRSTMLTIQNCRGLVRLRYPQVECGNRITDYRPAPEDLALRMSSAESAITQQANQIALKVNTATYNAERVYRGVSAPASPATDMLWLDTSLSPNLLKRYTGSAWVAMGAQELKTSGITIGPNNVSITTEQFLLQLLDPGNNENILMEMSAGGNVGFKDLYADNVVSSSVVNAYTGPSLLYVYPSYSGTSTVFFRTLREAVAAVSGRYLRYDVTITFLNNVMETIYESGCVEIYGVTGPHKLQISGLSKNKTICGYISIKNCSALIELYYLKIRESRALINGTGKNDHLVTSSYNTYVSLTGCVLDCNNMTYRALQCIGSYVDARYTELYNAYIGLGIDCGTANMTYCKGICDWSVFSVAGIVFCSNTVPTGGRTTASNGQIFAAGVTTDSGSATPPVTPEKTTVQYATTTRSWYGSWRSDTLDVIQGVYSDNGYSLGLTWNRGCMWFGNLQSVLYGTTVKTAMLTLHRKTGSGAGSAKTVYLCAITNYSASGTPNIAVNYGAIGDIGRDATVSFSIPVAAVQGLANGSYGGLCLYETPYNFGSSTYSNCYMRMSGTDDSSYRPCLTVVYTGGTAQG